MQQQIVSGFEMVEMAAERVSGQSRDRAAAQVLPPKWSTGAMLDLLLKPTIAADDEEGGDRARLAPHVLRFHRRAPPEASNSSESVQNNNNNRPVGSRVPKPFVKSWHCWRFCSVVYSKASSFRNRGVEAPALISKIEGEIELPPALNFLD